jgi:hypothetical protein
MSQEARRAPRVSTNVPVFMDVLGDPQMSWVGRSRDGSHDIERVVYPKEMVGQRLQGTLLDVAENGAQVSGPVAPPLLARV